MATFSQLVDSVTTEVSRPDMTTTVAEYLRQAIREVHLDPERATPVALWPNYAEAQVTADVDSAYHWLIPDTTRFQSLGMVRYDSVWVDGYQVHPTPLPRAGMSERLSHAYQQVGDRVIFKGYGGTGGVISIAYFQYPKALKYYPVATRPASYDEVDGYTYLPAYDVDDTTRESARLLTTNWLLERWDMILAEGMRAKIYKRLGDESRARLCYSAYMQLRAGLINSESADLGGPR